LIFGLFSNLTSIVGILLSLGIWSTAEGFGGPFIPGHSTDIGTAFPYAILFAVLLFLSAGRYYGVDQWLTSKLGRLGFLASGSFRRIRK
jgi:nitrite reductase (NO-forming)